MNSVELSIGDHVTTKHGVDVIVTHVGLDRAGVIYGAEYANEKKSIRFVWLRPGDIEPAAA